MTTCLIEALSRVPDFRAPRGRRYPLELVLLLVIMGTLSGCYGYAALENFAARHYQALAERLQLPKTRLPSDSTLRRVMMGINFEELAATFNQWASESIQLEPQAWLAMDGKSITSTVNHYSQAYQNFVTVVSVFSTRQGLTVGLSSFNNKKSSEIAVVQSLLEVLNLQGVVFTLDA